MTAFAEVTADKRVIRLRRTLLRNLASRLALDAQLAKDFAQLSQVKLTMPVLAIGGEKSLGNELARK